MKNNGTRLQAVKNSKDRWHHFSGELLEKNKRFVVTVKPGRTIKTCINTNLSISKRYNKNCY